MGLVILKASRVAGIVKNSVLGQLLVAGLCFAFALPAEAAGNAANGKLLYSSLNCSACHGSNPSTGSNKILRGANNGAGILSAIGSNVGGMGFLLNNVNAAQADDIGAYIANPNATTAAPTAAAPVVAVSPTSLQVAQGWNLLGNSLIHPLTAALQFNDQNIASVWRWDVATAGWSFYTSLLTVAELGTYTASNGLGILSQINPGEGFWVNAKANITLPIQTDTSLVSSAIVIQAPPSVGTSASSATVTPTSLLVEQGWNLLGDNLGQPLNVASQFNDQNIESVWRWDATSNRWQLYTPLLTAAALQAYATSKGYGVLGQINPGEGYWVSAKARVSLPVQVYAPSNSASTVAAPQTPVIGGHEGSEHEGGEHAGGGHEGGGHEGGEHEGGGERD